MTPFLELTIIFIFTALIALIFRILKQPLIISYIFCGILLSNYLIKFSETQPLRDLFNELGIAFLLFIVGLELKLKNLREIGWQSTILGTLQEIITILAGFIIAKFLGFTTIAALYIGAALSFSSTVIMVKLISDKGDLEKLYGKLAIGFLLVQDFITILILFLLPFFDKEFTTSENIIQLMLGISALGIIPLLSYRLLPKIEKFLTESSEFLFLFAVAFSLAISSLFKFLGLGLEAGALIAGISLSNLISSTEISSRLKPLRDFFLILFFIFIGSKIFVLNLQEYLFEVIVLSLFVLIGNPLIMLFILGPLGYKSKTSFLLGLTSAQISEFSFILINLGINLGHLDQQIISITALVGLITIFLSTYLFIYGDKIYTYLEKYLKIFERKKTKEEKEQTLIYEIILFGCDRVGFSLLNILKNWNKKFLIVDHNFDIVNKLKKENLEVIYGDAEEADLLQNLNFEKTKIVISTIPDYETNLLILKEYRHNNSEGIFIATAHKIKDALDLYKQGADYIIMPHFLGGEYVANILEKNRFNREYYLNLKEKAIYELQERTKLGQEHPNFRGITRSL
jgi:Kef-type K+ transport system membrane component KefB